MKIYYNKTKNGFILFNYNGIVKRYLYYNFKDALKDFKNLTGLKYKHNVKLIKDIDPITYGFMF